MCLDTRSIKVVSEPGGFGYKVMKKRGVFSSRIKSPYQMPWYLPFGYKIDKWYRDYSIGEISSRDFVIFGELLGPIRKAYPKGFHIFKTSEGALTCCEYITKYDIFEPTIYIVEYDEVVTVGERHGHECVVAKRMRFAEEWPLMSIIKTEEKQ